MIANYLGQVWTAAMGLVFIPLYIRYLGIEAYGLVGLFSVMQVWLGLLDVGLTPALGREMARFIGGGHSAQSIRVLLRSVEVSAGGLMLLILSIGVIASNWVAHHWLQVRNIPINVIAQVLFIMVLVVALRFFEGIYRSSMVGLQKQVTLNVAGSVLATLRWAGAAYVVAWVSPTAQAFVVWQGASSLIAIGIYARLTYRLIPPGTAPAHFSWSAMRGLSRFASGMFITSILVLLLTQVDKLILSRLLQLSDYGYYILASTVAGGLYILISPISQAYYPRLCELVERQDEKAMTEAFHQGAQLNSVIGGSAAIIVSVFSDELLRLWVHDSVVAQAVAPLLSILALGNLLNSIWWMPYQAQLAHGWTSLSVRSNTIGVLIVIPAILLLTPNFGAIGAAWVWVGLNMGYIWISAYFLFQRIMPTEKWRWYIQDLLFPLLPATCLAITLSKVLHPGPNRWAQLGILLFASCLTILVSGLFAQRLRSASVQFLLGLFPIRTEPRS